MLIATILLRIVCVAHVVRTGAKQIWLFAIMLLPIAGSIAYVIVVVIPSSRR